MGSLRRIAPCSSTCPMQRFRWPTTGGRWTPGSSAGPSSAWSRSRSRAGPRSASSSPARPQAGNAAIPQEQEVELTADRIVYDWVQRKLLLDGHVVAARGPAILRSARGSLDRRTGILRLEGGVLAVQGRQVLVAES